ncbi:hypothetical protein Tco_1209343 [Tanacetum coccineum]
MEVLSEMHRLGLSVTSSNILPFADTTLLITIVAQKSDFPILKTRTTLFLILKLRLQFSNRVRGNRKLM